MKKFTLILLTILACAGFINAQYLPVSPTHSVYDFLEEMNSEGHIDAALFVRPVSRLEVAEWLDSIDITITGSRQQRELDFYRKDFNKNRINNGDGERRKDLLFYRDSAFSFTLNPIGGGNYWLNKNGYAWHWWNGAEAYASWGRWGLYASLRDNHESERLTSAPYLNQNHAGAPFKVLGGGKIDYEEMKGGITYAWKGGSAGIMKDNFAWGSAFGGQNIFSGRAPAFVHASLKLNPTPWFRFSYVHGWLNSEVVDSSRSFFYTGASGNIYRKVYHPKYMAANMFSFRPVKKLWLSFGNSIIYDYETAHPAYFIPVMFFKAVDHSLNSGIDNMNSQMFLDVSSHLIKHTHIYATLFLDELAVKRIFKKDEYNFYSFKAGFRVSNLVPNFYTGLEYTISNALTFRHYIPTTTFESNRFNLGHYLGDNSRELVVTAGYKPMRGMDISMEYVHASKGPDHTLLMTPRLGIKPFTPVVWEKDQLSLQLSWELIHDGWLRLGYSLSNIRGEEDYLELWTPNFWRGRTGTLNAGLNYLF